MNKLIVLDGPDGTGKTTLSREIKKHFNDNVVEIHRSWSPSLEKDMDRYHYNAIDAAELLLKHSNVVIDRSWLSEICYSAVFRNGTNWENMHNVCFNKLDRLNASYIITLPKNKEQYEDHFLRLKNAREEMFEDMGNIYDAYYSLLSGEKIVDLKSTFADTIINVHGGLLEYDRFCDKKIYTEYDMFDEGKDIKRFLMETCKL